MAGLLLDTTVLIDVSRDFGPTAAWMARQPLTALYISSVNVAELFRGAYHGLGTSADPLAAELLRIHTRLLPKFAGRVLSFDIGAAEIWGRLMGMGEAQGARPPADDARIAAIALRHGLTVATSNTRHFARLCPTIDPRTA
jgi:predicted nucleic acid-binding protein